MDLITRLHFIREIIDVYTKKKMHALKYYRLNFDPCNSCIEKSKGKEKEEVKVKNFQRRGLSFCAEHANCGVVAALGRYGGCGLSRVVGTEPRITVRDRNRTSRVLYKNRVYQRYS